MFVVRPRVLLDLLAAWHPDFAAALRDLAADPARLEEVWPTLPRIAIDHAVAEPAAADGPGRDRAGRVRLGRHRRLPLARRRCSVDGGAATLQVLGRRRPRAEPRTRPGSSCPAAGGWSPWSGIDDVVVVDTPDALLVTTRARAQEVKAMVDRLRGDRPGRPDLSRLGPVGLGGVAEGVVDHVGLSAAPETSEQYCQTPTCLSALRGVLGAADRPVREGDVLAAREGLAVGRRSTARP